MDIGTSAGLAFSSGINAYFPLLALAIATRVWPTQVHINPHFVFITQPWFMILMAVLTLADIFADKIPVVDHVWDAIHTVIRPVAGALSAAAAGNATIDSTWLPVTLALGAVLAGVTHTTKAATRVTLTATTGGCLNIALSVGEDIVMLLSVAMAFLLPHVLLIAIILFVIAFLMIVPRIIRRLRRLRQMRHKHNAPTVPLQHGSAGRF
ncbi:DUF4126 domain-containing protein [Dictyobacter arantiisoli]|uniref:DUF4126 domain-containing protein n=1 Tax=Dictyobacter arantiisoli TaxID=2014874 RepID=A0A5A5TE68_9CHLR|nr:DUF4126 domain-containing protein [Dictyobacter arantiisoli]GCF09204.1 hypothetical protein KDI_27680 [Dictyobacter arantiisoli]